MAFGFWNKSKDDAANESSPLLNSQPLSEVSMKGHEQQNGNGGSSSSLKSSLVDMKEELEQILKEPEKITKDDSPVCCKSEKWILFIIGIGCTSYILFLLLVSMLSGDSSTPASGGHHHAIVPFSTKDPVQDLNLRAYVRSKWTSPPPAVSALMLSSDGKQKLPVPTNAWYQNMLLVRDEPSSVHRVYSSPYMLDTVGPFPGLRVHHTHVDGGFSVVQLSNNEKFSMTMGVAPTGWLNTPDKPLKMSKLYSVSHATDLGFTLEWEKYGMTAPIARGMPYATLKLDRSATDNVPTLYSPIALQSNPVVDDETSITCSLDDPTPFKVEGDIQLTYLRSDVTWIVFFSEPVWMVCRSGSLGKDGNVTLQVVDHDKKSKKSTDPLIARIAIANPCTVGKNPLICTHDKDNSQDFTKVLRAHANVYPGSKTSVSYAFDEHDDKKAKIVLNWDAQIMSSASAGANPANELIMYNLPHHHDTLQAEPVDDDSAMCRTSIIGPTCLVKGKHWTLLETLPDVGLRAARPPQPRFVAEIAKALKTDIEYRLPVFFERGAGDTYFSGKMLAKLSRILVVAEEINELCGGGKKKRVRSDDPYAAHCKNVTLPSPETFDIAVDRLKKNVQVWIDGTAETPFVYDTNWGGVTSCGCLFNGTACSNQGSPTCPAFEDQGLDFGNAYYNDQHFHYGYHIYAASVAAHFDPEWGRQHWEQVLLLVRSIANPSTEDAKFPLHRHKDWYQGSSWASGIPLPPYLNGKNQESSSESIAAYEAVALFGQVMTKAWKDAKDDDKVAAAESMRNVGRILTATEIRSTKRYWHISQKADSLRIYPEQYKHNVVGIVWSTMVQFGTWFGSQPYLPFGIQLIPITAISEERDDIEWATEIYEPFSNACGSDFSCTLNGWSFLELAILATVGHADTATATNLELPEEAYETAGGNGHSKTNMLWYLATRPPVANPINMTKYDVRGKHERRPKPSFELTDCYVPDKCTDAVLDTQAGQYTCRERITWLIDSLRNSQWEACAAVAGLDYPHECGACNPEPNKNQTSSEIPGKSDESIDEETNECGPCSEEQCNSDLNRCPADDRTFVCTDGPSTRGCSSVPWALDDLNCQACCEMTKCFKVKDEEANKVQIDIGNRSDCPPCEKSICYGKLNSCPLREAPFLCIEGNSVGGCSHIPWRIHLTETQCTRCCEITPDC